MKPILPDLPVEISGDLLPGASPGDALRAVLQLPSQLRFHGARSNLFLGGVLLAQDAEMRAMALKGCEMALAGYCELRGLFALGPNITARSHHAIALEVLGRVMPGQAKAMTAIDRYGEIMGGHIATIKRGDLPDSGAYDATMRFIYHVFHPEVLGLSARMSEVGRGFLAERDGRAMRARDRATSAREQIDEISRTVRLISLNARVEAARAGASGRAFGVIALEIKSLSEQAEAASEELAASVDDMMTNLRAT